jgi:hypothetical protein
VSDDELATAAHVVAGTVSLAVDDGGDPVPGTIEGVDAGLDVALVKLAHSVPGHVFSLDTTTPATGASVAAIGFPLNQPKTLTVGTVSGVERTVTLETGLVVTHLIQTDVPLNPGNSGGPLMNRSGEVVGVVSAGLNGAQGINYAASASLAKPLIETWHSTPQPPSPPQCNQPLGPQQPSTPVGTTPQGDQLTALVSRTFSSYFSAINAGDYETARLRQIPARRLASGTWASAMSTTFDFDTMLRRVTPTGRGALAWVTFTSLQAPGKGPRPGESCTRWSIDYTLVPADDGLLWIDGASGHGGAPISQACG